MQFVATRTLVAILCSLFWVGCTPKPYQASFVAVVAIPGSPHLSRLDLIGDQTGETAEQLQRQIFFSFGFWRDYVAPLLPGDLVNDPRIRKGLSISIGEVRKTDKQTTAEFKIELKYGGERTFDAMVKAFAQYRRKTREESEPRFPFDHMIVEVRKP